MIAFKFYYLKFGMTCMALPLILIQVTIYQGKAIFKKYIDILSHPCQNIYHQGNKYVRMCGGVGEKRP